jgi:hypothetical protein
VHGRVRGGRVYAFAIAHEILWLNICISNCWRLSNLVICVVFQAPNAKENFLAVKPVLYTQRVPQVVVGQFAQKRPIHSTLLE